MSDSRRQPSFPRSQIVNALINDLRVEAEKRGIRFFVVKGIAFEHGLYGKENVRSYNDIDVVVAFESLEKMHALLLEKGYRQYIGLSSARNLDSRVKAELLALHSFGKSTVDVFPYPVKNHLEKAQYAPYIRRGFPTIEVHESIEGLSKDSTEDLFNRFFCVDEWGVPTLEFEGQIIPLVANTYKNSETFPANNFDYSIKLQDYSDVKQFVLKWKDGDFPGLFWKILESYCLSEKARIVFSNLLDIFPGDNFCFEHVSGFWELPIALRVTNRNLCIENSTRILLRELSLRGTSAKVGRFSIYKNARVEAVVTTSADKLLAGWEIKDARVWEEDLLLELRIYPLYENGNGLIYRIDTLVSKGKVVSFGRWSGRFHSDGVFKRYGDAFEVVINDGLIELSLARDYPGLDFEKCFIAAEMFHGANGDHFASEGKSLCRDAFLFEDPWC